jgi:predicted esterase
MEEIFKTEKKIITPKTGRYYILGRPDRGAENICFALHGYGFLASDFADYFAAAVKDTTTVIVPEALNKFYVKGFQGKVGASWMTRNDRENEIKDYLNFLNNVYNQEIPKIFRPDLKISILGFSQGTATAARWIMQNKFKADKLILWGGGLPGDIDIKKARITFATTSLIIVVGENDEFVTVDKLSGEIEFLDENKIHYTLKRYPGRHEPDKELLAELLS